jgi:hypothetical protein
LQASQSSWDEKRARAWDLFLPPARPSPGEVAVYESALRAEFERGSRDCLLLGATPELRSLAHRLRCALRCVDRNAQVFSILGAKVHPHGEEHFECSDWLEMSLRPRVDLVFGDGSLNMLPGSVHQRFLENTRAVLNPGGLAALRVHLMESPRFADPAAVFHWYREAARKDPVFSATRTHLDMLWLDRGRQAIDFVEFHHNIRELHDSGAITDEEFAAYDNLLEFNKITLYYAGRDEFERRASRCFQIEDVRTGGDYTAHEQHPVYLLRREP